MNVSNWLRHCFLVCSSVFGSYAGVIAQDQDAAESPWLIAADKILEIGDQKGATASQRAEANRELLKLRPTKDADPRWQHAFVLVAMHAEKWTNALSLVTELVEQYPDYSPGYVAKVRVLMKLNKPSQAIVDLESLAEKLHQQPVEVTPAQHLSAARFLGLCVAFFAGPGKELIKPTQLADLEDAANKIPPELKEEYESSLNIVANEYKVFTEKGQAALDKHRKALQDEAQALRSELDSARSKTAADADAAQSELSSRWSQLQAQWQSAWNSCQGIRQSANSLRQQQGLLEGSLANLRPPRIDSNGIVDRNDEQRYQSEVASLRFSISRLDQQCNLLAFNYEQTQRQGMILEQQMGVLRNESQRLGMQLSQQNQSFSKIDQSIRSKNAAAAKAEPKQNVSKQRAEHAFKTYDDFNFHKERKLLLAR